MKTAEETFGEYLETYGAQMPGCGKRENISEMDLHPVLISTLRTFKENIAKTLNVKGLDDIPPLHLEFVGGNIPAASSFRYGGYCFIFVTLPMVRKLDGLTTKLSQFDRVALLLNVRRDAEDPRLKQLMFTIILTFVVTHEYAHHKFGHVPGSEPTFGRTWSQEYELVADACAILLLMRTVEKPIFEPIFASRRIDEAASYEEQCYLTIIVVLQSYFLSTNPPPINPDMAFGLTHPLELPRIASMFAQAQIWCVDFKPGLEQVLTRHFATITNIVADAVGAADNFWKPQAEFLASKCGNDYTTALGSHVQQVQENLRKQGYPGWPKESE